MFRRVRRIFCYSRKKEVVMDAEESSRREEEVDELPAPSSVKETEALTKPRKEKIYPKTNYKNT